MTKKKLTDSPTTTPNLGYNYGAFAAFEFYTRFLLHKGGFGDWKIEILHEPLDGYVAQTEYNFRAKRINLSRNKELVVYPEVVDENDEAYSAFHEILHACLVDFELLIPKRLEEINEQVDEGPAEDLASEYAAIHHTFINRMEKMFFDQFFAEAFAERTKR